MKNINLSVDGGGTSLRIIAFDDGLNLIAQSRSGPTNSNYESMSKIREHMTEASSVLIKSLTKDCRIKNIYITIVGPNDIFKEIFLKEAGDYAKDANIQGIIEWRSHILASSLGSKGGVALAGTGSGAIYVNEDDGICIGGYGIPIGDEGSGAWIGIQGMSAAIRHISGWGEETLLTGMLYEYLKIQTSDSITSVIYGRDSCQRSIFAGFCRYVGECERAGDKTSHEIIYSAGRLMGLQMISVIKRAEAQKLIDSTTEVPEIYASGGAWKCSGTMLKAMRETVCLTYPNAICKYGMFDPVMGGVIQFINDTGGKNAISMQCVEYLQKEFSDYLVRINDG